MARALYFDCFSGASGDMILGALLDLGLPLAELRRALGSLAVDVGEIAAERVLRAGVSATKFRSAAAGDVPATSGHERRRAHAPAHSHAHAHPHGHDHGHVHDHEQDHVHDPHQSRRPSRHDHSHHHHDLDAIAGYIRRSALSSRAQERAIHLFRRLAEAEAAIHDMPVEKVHLHEVGALDSIVDIVGAVYGLEWLGADEVSASPMNVGSGTVECAHGTFPVPAPATASLLEGVPVYGGEVAAELVTPTGALIVTDYATRFGPLPMMRIERIGYGAGSRDFRDFPNVLRLVVGETAAAAHTERIVVMECEIDDMNPQLFGPLMDRLLDAGALDVFYVPVQMKKNRPGTLVTVLSPPDRREALSGVLFAETTTIGVRYQEMLRERLERAMRTVETPLGPMRFKVATRDGRVLNASPEFDDCVRLAEAHGLSIKDVQAIGMKAWLDAGGRE